MSWEMTDLTWEAFRDRVPSEVDTAIVPIGTVEAHGAIPLGTDLLIPEAMAADLAPRLPALIAPAIPYGVTNSLLPYPGSTTVSTATFAAYVFEAAAGLVDAGFRRIVLLNGHGGQSREVADVVARLWLAKRTYSVAIEWWELVADLSREIYGDRASGHAGVEETAMILAIAPELVNRERATTIRRTPLRDGVKARPFPASVMLDRPEKGGDGAPILDLDRAREFRRRSTDLVLAAIRDVFDGWNELRG